jgi:hypothetical protein
MLNVKLISTVLLASIAITLSLVDYRTFMLNGAGEPGAITYKAAGIVDSYFKNDTYAKNESAIKNDIFSVGRKKEQKLAVAVKQNDAPIFDLMGVTITPNRKIAILQDLRTKQTKIVEEGEKLNDLTIVKIHKDRIITRAGEGQGEILLRKQSNTEDKQL